MPPQERSYAAAHFALELDGRESVGIFRQIEGGGVRTEVMTHQHGAGHERWRQLGKPRFDDIKLQVGMAMSRPFYDWITHFFRGQAERKHGSIVAADFHYKERARREFKEAMIKELTFPKLEGKDQSAAYMTVALAVEDIVFKKGSGETLPTGSGFDRQKLWTACNFRFELSGFEQACKRVTKIDSFTIKQQIIEHHMGGQLAPIKTPSVIEFPNIAFYVPESDAQPFFDHFSNDNRLYHKNDIAHPSKLHGSIVALDNEHRTLFTLSYSGADIFSVTPDKADSQSDEIKLVKIEIHTERMTFDYPKID
jgi:phage tail-like protein